MTTLLVVGCGGSGFGPGIPSQTPEGALSLPREDVSKCVRFSTGQHRAQSEDEATDDEKALLADIPPDVRRTVRAARLERGIARLLQDRKANLPEFELMVRGHAVELRLQLLKVQIDATTFEADCTGELLEGLQATLDQEEGDREMHWTVASIVTGSVAAAAAGAWDLAAPESNGSAITGIAGGVLAGGMGLAAVIQPEREIVLDHPRNLMTPIVTGQDPDHIYPSFVFNLMTLPQENGPPPRELLRTQLDAILDDAVEPQERKRAAALVYGTGGTYDRRLLDARETMLDEVERTIAAFSRDLEVLSRYFGSEFGR
jgi:hypothetical protein